MARGHLPCAVQCVTTSAWRTTSLLANAWRRFPHGLRVFFAQKMHFPIRAQWDDVEPTTQTPAKL